MSENKEEQIFEIAVISKQRLTNEEMQVVARDFKSRMEGYTTTCPEELIGASIALRPILDQDSLSDINELKLKVIKALVLLKNYADISSEFEKKTEEEKTGYINLAKETLLEAIG